MKIGNNEVILLSDGSFTLDPGAAFGIVPTPFWSKRFETTPAGRVRLALNIPYIKGDGYQALIDTGIGKSPDEKYRKIFEMEKPVDLVDQLEAHGRPEDIDLIVHSHLHFDHFGHSLDRTGENWLFRNATLIAQKREFNSYRRPVEFTVANYGKTHPVLLAKANKVQLEGTERIKPGLMAVRTGGHTSGHQVIILKDGGKEMIYFGDLIPTAFHLKLPYVTAIDTYPLETVEMKKKLIQRAIRNGSVCIFNHDLNTPAGVLSGTPQDVKVEAVEL